MLNNVNLIGRITKDIEIRKTQSNKSVIRFTLAIDEGKDRTAQFIECQAWEGTADTIAKYVHKGDMFNVSGKLINNNYESNGIKHYSYLVLVNGFTLLPNQRRSEEVEQPTPVSNNNPFAIEDDDLPF
jgi:single-strand DNA-binding protein